MASRLWQEAVAAAVRDFAEHGYDSVERLARWEARLRSVAEAEGLGSAGAQDLLSRGLSAVFNRQVERGAALRHHAGISRFTVDRVRPELRRELDRRIAASANLIKLNRPQAVDKTLQRFSGWATSVPPGGSAQVNRRRVARDIGKPVRGVPFEERRVLIDQGHKLSANISAVIAEGGGAIGGLWHSHWRQTNYNYRPDHKERDDRFYALRGSWADERGLLKPEAYADEITQPAEEPFCRCFYRYVYALRDVPRRWLSARGEAELDNARRQARAAMGAAL